METDIHNKEKNTAPALLGRRETLEYCVQHDCSIARFGGDEMKFVLEGRQPGFAGLEFQQPDPRLALLLLEILNEPREGLLLCFNNAFLRESERRVVLDYERGAQSYVRTMSVHHEKDIGLLDRAEERREYAKYFDFICRNTSLDRLGDATCFDLGYFRREYEQKKMDDVFALYKKLFEGRNVVFVAPDQPRIGRSFRTLVKDRVIRSPSQTGFLSVPERDEFAAYEDLLGKILEFKQADAVFIQAGPTAAALAAELAWKHGVRAFDAGTLNVSLDKAAGMHGVFF